MASKYASSQPEGFTNRIEKVAIVGAGGSIGKHLTEALIKTGKHTITAIARPKSTSKLPEGLNIVHVDYSGDDDAALVEALQGQQALIITMSVTASRGTVNKLVCAAAKAGVPYILPNWFGHDDANNSLCDDSMLSANRDSILAEFSALKSISYIFLVCNFWYEFSLGGGPDRFGFDFKNRSFIQFDEHDVVFNTTTWPQCGRAIASLLSLKEFPDDESDKSPTLSQFANSSVYISSFRVSQRDMWESVKRVTDTTDSDWTITHESVIQRWKESRAAVEKGDFAVFPRMLYSRMFFPTADGDYQSRLELHNDLLGLPIEDLDEFTAIAMKMGMNYEVVKGH
ncbi:NAD(P)-binding protein [Penicillium cataractarum]|uniref:NAD(P)-binding protein n=1 Tax=Penicillium cataractarum TaxID=2100454 RepID=A0A9W9V951_9EURO|nr:NAD(P)-binding protein [Penicillium cataractarum]KAJ5370960.1 NAD(P)-binding protein [Penicillium cataractarum]